MWQNSYNGQNALYLVPTPIGNLEDITYRAIEVLKNSDVIFSEDTRVTLNLLNHFQIKKKLYALHDHNENEMKDRVLDFLSQGHNVALVSDRGTPIISDPGYKTVEYVIQKGFSVIALPGANAFVPALIASGINPHPFLFYGFLNSKPSLMEKELRNLKEEEATLIFYEAPHRIEKTLRLMYEVFGNRKVSLSREISKKFESIYRGTLEELVDDLSSVKGEFVIVVEGNKEKENFESLDICQHVDIYIQNGLSVMDAIKKVAKERMLSKNEVYQAYHHRREE